jgi:MFS family permease
MLEPYQRLLSRPGTLRFSLLGLVGRLPMSMTSLGVVLLVQAATGSYAAAGLVSATFMLANAAAAIAQGRMLDRLGQGRVLGVASMVFAVSTVVLMWSVQAGWPMTVTYLAAAAGGATLPQIGSAVRARWAHVLSEPRELQTAFALEGVVDEAVFITGPILVTVAVASVHPVAGLAIAVAACLTGSLAFSAQRSTEPPAHERTGPTGQRAAMPWRTVLPLAVVSAALGGSEEHAEVTTVAFADEHGNQGLSGLLLAVLAAGSLVAGVAAGAFPAPHGPLPRVRWGSLAMGLAWLPALFAPGMTVLALLLFLGGLTIAPTMAATFSLAERVVPPSRLTEGMGILQTGITAGVAPGAGLSGWIVDHHSAATAYAVCLGAGLVAAAAALLIPRLAVPDRAVRGRSD